MSSRNLRDSLCDFEDSFEFDMARNGIRERKLGPSAFNKCKMLIAKKKKKKGVEMKGEAAEYGNNAVNQCHTFLPLRRFSPLLRRTLLKSRQSLSFVASNLNEIVRTGWAGISGERATLGRQNRRWTLYANSKDKLGNVILLWQRRNCLEQVYREIYITNEWLFSN